MYPSCVNDLIECFKRLPGIGQKTAERMVFSILNDFEVDDYDIFSDSIINVKRNIRRCNICHSITDKEVCNICEDKTRNTDILMVVENSKDVFLLEKNGNFNGYYHVLGGLISPFDDIGPDDINVKDICDRILKDDVKEVVFLVKSCIEADTTVLYMKRLLSDVNVKISKVANGIPVGADMDYIDSLTLESALNNRKEVLD